MGEHGLLWALAFVAVSSVLLGTWKTKWRSDIMTALAAIIAEADFDGLCLVCHTRQFG